MKLLLDEMYPPQIARELSRRGFDVVAAKEAPDLQHLLDEEMLRRATLEGRVLVTENAEDFAPLLERLAVGGMHHNGVIFTASRSLPRRGRMIGLFVRALEAYLREHPGDDHDYGGLDVAVLKETVRRDLPALLRRLDAIREGRAS